MNLSEQLRLLSIFHYVVGGLHALFGSFGLIHLTIGIGFLMAPKGGSPNAPPEWFGLVFAVIGGLFVLCGWTLGALTVYSGRCIAKRRKRTFSVVMAAINCAMVPMGTVLGVFTIIVLTKDETRVVYGERLEPPPLRS